MITVRIEPDGKTRHLPDVRSVHALLNRLGLTRTQALIIRSGELLTADRKLDDGDQVLVRLVVSRG